MGEKLVLIVFIVITNNRIKRGLYKGEPLYMKYIDLFIFTFNTNLFFSHINKRNILEFIFNLDLC